MNAALRVYTDNKNEEGHNPSFQTLHTAPSLESMFAKIKQQYMPVYIESLRSIGFIVVKDQEDLQSFFFYTFKKGIETVVPFLQDQNQSETILEGVEEETFNNALRESKLWQIESTIVLRKLYMLSKLGFISGVQSSLNK